MVAASPFHGWESEYMSNGPNHTGSSTTFDIHQLPDGLQDVGIAFTFEQAMPELQQKLVNALQDAVNAECAPPAREATEQLISQLLTKAGPVVLNGEAEKADQALLNLLPELAPAVQERLKIALRRQKAIRKLQAERQADLVPRLSSSTKRGARVKIIPAEVVQAVSHLDPGEGVTNAQVQEHFGIPRPKATSLLKTAFEAGLLKSTKPKAGVSTKYWVPKNQPSTLPTEAAPGGDLVQP